MIEARDFHTATLLPDGRVLVAGGASANGALASAELYDPRSGSWVGTGKMIAARYGHTATLLPNGKVLVAGGSSSSVSFGQEPLASAELYDAISGSWTATGMMHSARSLHTATLLPDGTVLAAGPGTTSTLAYDLDRASWTSIGRMDETRQSHTATLLPDGKVLVAGGRIRISGDDTYVFSELFDPGRGVWIAAGGMVEARSGHTATLLPGGEVLIAGGAASGISSDALASAELYDSFDPSWTATTNMQEIRDWHTATLLPDGKVLVAGGRGGPSYSGAHASTELYDPDSGTWTATVRMIEARYGHTATLLSDGTVLVVGGFSSSGSPLASAELYDARAGS
jgi:hypothetical protein